MNTISICGIPFIIKEVDEIPTDTRGEVVHGAILYSRAAILLRGSLPEELKQLTLIHEWVHGALVMIGRTDLSDDEMLVQNVALAINQAFELKEDVIIVNISEANHEIVIDNAPSIDATTALDEESCNEVMEEEVQSRENPYYEAITTLEEFKAVDDWSAVYMPELHDAIDTVIEAVRHRIHKGEWRGVGMDMDSLRFKCNQCGRIVSERENYCPNCGADMRKGAENG